MPTEILLLNYEEEEDKISEFSRFLTALSAYKIPGRNESLFDPNRIEKVEKLVVDHIQTKVIPRVKSGSNVQLKITQELPVILFAVTNIHKTELPVRQEVLLFIGNVDMLENQSMQGGFYTKDEAMIQILLGFYNALYKKATFLK